MAAIRIKCPACGEVLNIQGDCLCSKCGAPLTCEGLGEIQMYRMGNPMGIAVGYGIYLNGEPMGHMANKELLHVMVPYGTYQIHFTCGATRKCEDATVTVSPENPIVYVKGSIQVGFWTNKLRATVVNAEDMPQT